RPHAQAMFLSDAGQRDAFLQVGAEDLKPSERRAALDLGQAIGAGMWSRRHGLGRDHWVNKRDYLPDSVADFRPNSNAALGQIAMQMTAGRFMSEGMESISISVLYDS